MEVEGDNEPGTKSLVSHIGWTGLWSVILIFLVNSNHRDLVPVKPMIQSNNLSYISFPLIELFVYFSIVI